MGKMPMELYDYYTSWSRYAYGEEENRFLTSSETDLLKICDCIDLKSKQKQKTSGGVPIHYEDDKLYVLKEGPHTRVCGESGSKKSRTVCRGAAISAILNGDSFILTDPKGEISSDPKIQYLLKKSGQDTYVLDFRKFNKDGFNCLSYAFDLMLKGQTSKAMAFIDRFVGMLIESKKAIDDFWNDQAGELIKSVMQMLLITLVQVRNGRQAYHLASVRSFIRQEKEGLQRAMERILKRMPENDIYNPVKVFADILENPEKTYACIISSANALLRAFCSSEDLLRMLSVQTFQINEFYQKPCALFLVIPDEVGAYDSLVGYLVDTFYQILVEEYNEKYQTKCEPACNIHIICDEVASICINDMAAKISASRSRQIDWTLIYQSDKQMEQAYENDFGTICGNCKNYIFLGSSDYGILKDVSEQIGNTYITPDGTPKPIVSVADLRKMKKEKEYKDALILTGNYIYCAKLPDYDIYSFLKKAEVAEWFDKVNNMGCPVYTPEKMYQDFCAGKIRFV